VAHILGLFSLFKFDTTSDPTNGEVLYKLKEVAEVLDKTIFNLVKKTSELESRDFGLS